MSKPTKKILEHYDIDGDWDEMIFTGHNPTSSDVQFDFFNGLVSLQTNVPNTPTGYVQPPINVSIPSIPTSPYNYPSVNQLDIFTIGGAATNNTMKYDSANSRMYMTYKIAGNNFLTWKDSVDSFFDFSIALAGVADIVDSAVSTTSNKIILISNLGRIFIVDTLTNTLITSFNSPQLGDAHRQVEWNSVKNTWYISVNNGWIIEISAVTNAVVASFLIAGGKQPYGLAFKTSTNEIFVTYNATNEIASINCTTNTPTVIIANTITTNPRVIIYNPTNNLVTYGSNISSGVRTFNATTLVFSASVINITILDIANYTTSNKLYLLPASGNNIVILDSNNLTIENTVNSTTSITSGAFAQIAYFVPDNQIYYNINVSNNPTIVGRILMQNLVFYITGSDDYNETVRDFFYSPAWVRRIYFYSKNRENLYQVIQHIYKDANGNECNFPRIPSLSIGINQFQDWIAEINFKDDECVFGVNQWFQNVLVKAGTELGMLLIYKQIEKVKLLGASTGMLGKTICEEYASCPNKLRKWSEKDLILNDYTEVTPFKQNMFEGLKDDAVKPFDFSMLTKYEIEDGCKRLCE